MSGSKAGENLGDAPLVRYDDRNDCRRTTPLSKIGAVYTATGYGADCLLGSEALLCKTRIDAAKLITICL